MAGRKAKSDDEDKKETRPIIVRNTTDLQRLKLEKLMKNPEKPVMIPEKPKERGMPSVPDFVRNVMGSSAGAGSGEFHVYRHLRRKEYARQKYMKEKGERERLDVEYHEKLEKNIKLAEDKTAKKRKKRLKRKQKQKKKAKSGKPNQSSQSEDTRSESSSEDESQSEEKKEETQEQKTTDSGGSPKTEATGQDGENNETSDRLTGGDEKGSELVAEESGEAEESSKGTNKLVAEEGAGESEKPTC